MVTKKEIAEHLGISRTAVSLVLNNSPSSTISAETRSRILQAARELGYREHESSPRLCYLLYGRNANDPRYMDDLQIIERAASSHHYGLAFMNITREASSIAKLQKALALQEIDGYLISGDVDEALIELFQRSGTPFILFGMPVAEHAAEVSFVGFDDRSLAQEATARLIGLGHRRIALFMGSLDYQTHQQSLEGYCQAHSDAGIPLDKSLIQISNEENGYELAKRGHLLELGYTAAFCTNTIIQFGALQYLQRSGFAVPRDISLLGSGLSELVKASTPQLSSMYVQPSEKAKAVDLLLEAIEQQPSGKPAALWIKKFALYEGGTLAPLR